MAMRYDVCTLLISQEKWDIDQRLLKSLMCGGLVEYINDCEKLRKIEQSIKPFPGSKEKENV